MALAAAAISALNQRQVDLVELASEQLPLLGGHSIAERRGILDGRTAAGESVGRGAVIGKESSTVSGVLDLVGLEPERPRRLSDLEHPVTAYLNGLAPSSRRPQLAALEAIARRSTQLFSAETMPWHRLRRPHVLKIRSLLEENYLPATANRMLSALRGVLRECWHSGLLGTEEYHLAVDVDPLRGESEPRGRDLSAVELRALLEACARAPQEGWHRQDSMTRRRRDAAFLSLLYASGLRRAEAVALELADCDLASGQLRVRRGKGRKPRPVSLPASALPALQDWLEVRGGEPGPLFAAVLKNGRLVRDGGGRLQGLSGSAAWAICKERGHKAGIAPPAPHDLRRTWTGDLLEAGWIWPRCRRWRATLLFLRLGGTIGETTLCSGPGPPSCASPTSRLRTDQISPGVSVLIVLHDHVVPAARPSVDHAGHAELERTIEPCLWRASRRRLACLPRHR